MTIDFTVNLSDIIYKGTAKVSTTTLKYVINYSYNQLHREKSFLET